VSQAPDNRARGNEPLQPAGAPGEPHGISRRDAVKLLAVAPLTGALHWTPNDVHRAVRQMHAAATASAPAAHRFFTPHEHATVSLLVDLIIPADARSGSATDAGVPAFMDYMLAEAHERTQTEMRGGLAWLDAQCMQRGGTTFVGATPAQRTALLDEIAWPKRARPEMSQGVAFFNSMRDLTASGFFSSQMGYRDVQYEGEVFNPNWNGCPPAALTKLGVSYDVMKTRIPSQA